MVEEERRYDVGRGIELCAQSFGDAADPAVLLVAGLGMQLNSWDERFCRMLVERGLRVVRFDNRDVGRSTHLNAIPVPGPGRIVTRRFAPAQYDLGDMAQDTANLIEAMDLRPAHVVGISMGGMIGQTLAARHGHLVASLTSIMSTTGHRLRGQPAPSTLRMMLRKPATERDAAAAMAVQIFRHIGSRGFPFDESSVRELALEAWDRGRNPAGPARQIGAILKSGNRTRELRSIRVPTLVIHGDRDPMVHPSGGKATAAAIPGARLETIAGMGHDLPEGAWPRIAGLICDHVLTAGGRTRAGVAT